MQKTFVAITEGPMDVVIDLLSDLANYPHWLDVVSDAQPAAPIPTDGDNPAWMVTLTAKVGPFARSKRLRMVRTEHTTDTEPAVIRFQRGEADGRDHARWDMDAVVSDQGGPVEATITLSYGGSLWTGPLEPILDAAARKAADRLAASVVARNRKPLA